MNSFGPAMLTPRHNHLIILDSELDQSLDFIELRGIRVDLVIC